MWVNSIFARWLTATVVVCIATSAVLDAQPRGDDRGPPGDVSGPPPRDARGPGGAPPFGGSGGPTEGTSKQGYLFTNGEYVPPPYDLRLADDVLTVNGKPLECILPAYGYGGRGSGPRSGEQRPWRSAVTDLQSQLNSDLAVLSFANQPYVVLDTSNTYDLLKSLTMQSGRAVRQAGVRERLPEGFDKAVWDQWLDGFAPPGDLLQRAAALMSTFESSEREAAAALRATRWLNRLSYPLAVSGMVLSVLAVGHLLGGRPHARQNLAGLDESPEMIRSLNWSLLLVAAFSLFDLTWTILAANAGQLRELNPIGSHLIENPRQLAGFKIGITMPSLALLWLLRKHKRAQVAAWWVCLILTFVTLRWLTLSPLYVTT
jgi:Domain of unknown function (DUF5658)